MNRHEARRLARMTGWRGAKTKRVKARRGGDWRTRAEMVQRIREELERAEREAA